MLVINAGYLIDGISDEVKLRQSILIEGDRILRISPVDKAEIPLMYR